MTRRSYTDEQLEFVRSKAVDHTDVQIAALMDWPAWKVFHVRNAAGIPPFKSEGFWVEARRKELRHLIEVEGLTTDEAGERLGCNGGTVRKAVRKFGYVRNPAIAHERKIEKSRQAGLKGCAARWAGHTPAARVPKPAQAQVLIERRHFGNGAFSPRERERGPLGDRILEALAERPLSAATLASLIGDKEAHVSIQLAAFAHAGRVSVGEGGPRDRKWSIAA